MYKTFVNTMLLCTSTYIFNEYVYDDNLTYSTISAVFLTVLCILFESLHMICSHQKIYTNLKSASNDSKLEKFYEDGDHLPSLYNYLKNIGVELKDKNIYLGSNRNLFERPYKFLNDTNNVIKRILREVDYINELDLSKVNGTILFKNTKLDKNKKERWLFYLKHMKPSTLRDTLYTNYVALYKEPKNLNYISYSDIKSIEERKEMLKNIPDHLKEDLFNVDFVKR